MHLQLLHVTRILVTGFYLRSNLRLEGSVVDRRDTNQPNNPSGSVEVQQIYLIVFATATTLPEYLLLVFTFDHILDSKVQWLIVEIRINLITHQGL